jgi:hypothetical protein
MVKQSNRRTARMPTMNMPKLRAWWFERQGLASPNPAFTPAQTLERAGWSRSVGGASPYLGFYARARTSRSAADRALADMEIHELPSARGCTYIVPKSDFALALMVGQGFSDAAAMNTARRFLGVTDAEIDDLQEKVVSALAAGPLDPRALKDAVGNASRNLGDEGKKRGQTTTLPLALGFLQSSGRIRRIPLNGRIDQQRYAYSNWDPSPLRGVRLSKEEAFQDLAKRFFKWTGPAQGAHFKWFSGLGVTAAKAAVTASGAIPVETGSDWLMLPEDLRSYKGYEQPAEPRYALVSGLDSFFLLRRDLQNLVDEQDREFQMIGEKGPTSIGGGLQDLSNHAILDRGRVIGIWEYDSIAGEIVWHTFSKASEELRGAVDNIERLIREELGDCRSFSLDSPESRKPIILAIRDMNK